MKGKVAVMEAPLKLKYYDYDIPSPGSGSIIVEVTRTNVCGSEIHIWNGHHPQIKRGVLGHEMIGRVYKRNKGVETDFAGEPISEGDRVVTTYFQICRKCSACQQGQINLCENAYEFWTKPPEESPHFHGTFASHYYIHPNMYFYKVPDNVPDVAAASANCALSQVYYGIEKACLTNGQSIVIQGAGGLGLNACAVAKEKGAQVIVLDTIPSRLEQAKRFGADHLLNIADMESTEACADAIKQLTNGKGADVGMELAGVPQAFAEGIHFIRPGGTYVMIGNISPGKTTPFDPGLLTRKSIKILPIVRYKPWYLNKALNFLSENITKYPFAHMLDKDFTLAEVEKALDESTNRNVTRASIVMQ